MEHQDPAGLASAETYLIHVLKTSTPPRAAAAFDVTGAAQEFRAQHGTWDLEGAGLDAVEELLAKHAR